MGVKFGGATVNNGNKTYLLLIMHASLSQKIGLHDLMNLNLLEKGKSQGGNKQNINV